MILIHQKPLYIWDNGKGMTPNQLKNWATMGVTQADNEDKIPENLNDKLTHRGYISRFGVGAKSNE